MLEVKFDWESLLEFEGSLSDSFPRLNSILLQNLERRIEQCQGINHDKGQKQVYTSEDLDRDLMHYDFSSDEFTTCTKCGLSLKRNLDYKPCCETFIEDLRVVSSNLEKSFLLLFINIPTNAINTLPNCTSFFFVRQGMPFQMRSIIWKRLLLLNHYESTPEGSRLVYENFQHSYNREISRQIDKDISRTFPTITFFNDASTVENLSTILNVYANYDVELGYCQGLLFLVGVLYHHLEKDSELTFHALISIMETEPELHDIFTSNMMSVKLNEWKVQFMSILNKVDPELHDHLNKTVDPQVFLYQWWLSFLSSHTPDMVIVNKIMDLCIFEGWKVGLFKVSLGLLVANKPILLALGEEDEEVIYQHMLNEAKWGAVIKDVSYFFGETILSWDDLLFILEMNKVPAQNLLAVKRAHSTHKRSGSSVINMFKNLSVNITRSRSDSDNSEHSFYTNSEPSSAVSSTSVFSRSHLRSDFNEAESLFSDMASNESVISGVSGKLLNEQFRYPVSSKEVYPKSLNDRSLSSNLEAKLQQENDHLRKLLREAYDALDDSQENILQLKSNIVQYID